jgi:type VI protein secretion system component Hcp
MKKKAKKAGQNPSKQVLPALSNSDLSAVSGGATKSSAKLFQACCTGKHLPTVTLDLY